MILNRANNSDIKVMVLRASDIYFWPSVLLHSTICVISVCWNVSCVRILVCILHLYSICIGDGAFNKFIYKKE